MDKPYLGGTEGVLGPMCLGGGVEKSLGRPGCWIQAVGLGEGKPGSNGRAGHREAAEWTPWTLTVPPPYPTGGSSRPATQKQAPPQ